MLTKAQYLVILQNETEILKHLHTKLPAASFDYRPSEGQRSTLELLRYLTYAPQGGMRAMLEGSWDCFGPLKAEAEQMNAAGFPAAMDRQLAVMTQLVDGVSEGEMMEREVTYVTGDKLPLGQALVMGPLRWLAAYRMQIFLYAKASGVSDLNTANVWAGRDPQKKAE